MYQVVQLNPVCQHVIQKCSVSFVLFVKQQEGKVATPTAMVYGVGVVFGYVMCEADNL